MALLDFPDPSASPYLGPNGVIYTWVGGANGYWSGSSANDGTAAFDDRFVNISGDTMTGLLTLSADPTAALHAATKQYVDLLGDGASIHVGDTEPADKEQGSLWWNTTDNTLYIYYDEGSGGTAQWVIAIPQGGGSDSQIIVSDTPPPTAELREGALWWNSDESDLQLYVLYNNGTEQAPDLKWIEASPMPGAGDDGYVNVTGDNMTGDLTLGTDKITLDAGTGAATFAGDVSTKNIQSGLSSNGSVGGQGFFFSGWGGNSFTSRIRKNTTGNGPVLFIDSNTVNDAISLNADGSADFSGRGKFLGRIETEAGQVVISNTATDTPEARSEIQLNAYGSYGGIGQASIRYERQGGSRNGDLIFGSSPDGSSFFRELLRLKRNGDATFLGSITANNVTFNLEPDNPANYTTTTDADGNETQVYNGPTLDVKDRLQNLISRLDAIEANEVVDDATDSALLQLVASLSARLDERDAQVAALTARVTTLES